MKYTIKHNDTDYEVAVKRTGAGIVVTHGSTEYVVHEQESADATAPLPSAPATLAPPSAVSRSATSAAVQSSATATTPPAATSAASGAVGQVTAPMTGVIKTVHVSVGDTVVSGQVVVTMEAMKMDITIEAKADGAVTAISISESDAVQQGQSLLTIQ